MKYITFESDAHQEDTHEFNTAAEAIEKAKDIWAHLTNREKKTISVFVLESVNPDEEAMDHFDGNTIYEARDEEAEDDE